MKSVAEVMTCLGSLDYQIDPEVLAGVQEILAPVKNRTWQSGLEENN